MKDLTLRNIEACCGGTYFGDEAKKDMEIAGITIDSRSVTAGGLFVPIRGERADGHDFIPAVFKEGALACLSERKLRDPAGPYILVRSSKEALGQIAALYRQSLDIFVVGITGSVGKTSTKEMIASVLGQKFKTHKTAGNFNNEIGLPLTIFGLCEEHEAAVLEMGISDFGEMSRLAKIASPDIGVITNIGPCHLERLGDRDGVLRAKAEMFDFLKEGAAAILNGDDDKLRTVRFVCGKKPVFYGKGQGDVYATDVAPLGMEGVSMRLHLQGESRTVVVPIPGEHNVYNALAAACVGCACGMGMDDICRGIESAKTIGGRSNLIKKGGITVIDDCYNANPVSMRASLDVLSRAEGRKIAVLGDMGELGKDERALHAQVGAYAAEKKIDLLYCAGELSREIADGAAARGLTAFWFETKEELLKALLPELKKGDAVLVKASHFMQFSKIAESLPAQAS